MIRLVDVLVCGSCKRVVAKETEHMAYKCERGCGFVAHFACVWAHTCVNHKEGE